MTGFQAFVLGLVQGIAEFLPISSSGHLIIVPWMLGERRHTYTPFVIYRLAVAALILSLIATGARDATL